MQDMWALPFILGYHAFSSFSEALTKVAERNGTADSFSLLNSTSFVAKEWLGYDAPHPCPSYPQAVRQLLRRNFHPGRGLPATACLLQPACLPATACLPVVCVCVRACMHICVRLCMCAYMHACVCCLLWL